MDTVVPADVSRLADTLSLLHLQMHTLAGMATDEQRERLERLLEDSPCGGATTLLWWSYHQARGTEMITYIAYANGSKNDLGPAGAGVSVYRKVTEDGQVTEEREIASWVVADVSDEDGELDTLRAERFLRDSGWDTAGLIWQPANDGQMAIQVVPVA